MPSILLINDNKIVSRLLQLSSQKQNYTLEEINDYSASQDSYNVVFIDSEKYDEKAWEALKSTLTYDRLGFIGDKTHAVPEGFDFSLEKPFLPTDFVNLMDENFKVMDSNDESDILDEMEGTEEDDELDLDNLEEIDLGGELEPMEELEDLDLEEIVEPSTTLTTGIADSVVSDGSANELSDLMGEIDNMEEEPLEEMDLDTLEDESEIVVEEPVEEVEDLALDEASVVDENMVKASLEEVESELAVEAVSEEAVEENASVETAVVAAAVAATAVAEEESEEIKEEAEDTLSILDGVESIEHEDDYLKENEHVVEDLAGEFDSLNADEVKQLMEGGSEEEILSEELESVGEEKVVEANDLEEIITRAVAKAITKEMLQEALNDMEISVTLKTKDS